MRDYTKQIEKFWPAIMQAWDDHADKRPMIECDLASKKVRAYASGEYIDSLSERTREATRREFALTMDEGGIMVFVQDSKNRVLQSYSFTDVDSAGKRKPSKEIKRMARKDAKAQSRKKTANA